MGATATLQNWPHKPKFPQPPPPSPQQVLFNLILIFKEDWVEMKVKWGTYIYN